MVFLEPTCIVCEESKPLESFAKDKRNKTGRQGKCSSCVNAYNVRWKLKHADLVRESGRKFRANNKAREQARTKKYKRANWQQAYLFSKRASCKKVGISFALTREQFAKIVELTGSTCPCCQKLFDRKIPWQRFSLDRKDSQLGYTYENVQALCRRCNLLKSNATLEELMCLVEFLRKGLP